MSTSLSSSKNSPSVAAAMGEQMFVRESQQCLCVCMYDCATDMCMRRCVCICMHPCIHVHNTCVCVSACMHVYMYIIRVRVYLHVYIIRVCECVIFFFSLHQARELTSAVFVSHPSPDLLPFPLLCLELPQTSKLVQLSSCLSLHSCHLSSPSHLTTVPQRLASRTCAPKTHLAGSRSALSLPN